MEIAMSELEVYTFTPYRQPQGQPENQKLAYKQIRHATNVYYYV